jgi:pimeloyl-ACP methyl ester carboxylesterase
MTFRQIAAAAVVSTLGLTTGAFAKDAPSVVLVHGAWANGSSWAEVVPLLQARGLNVVAVHNPLLSLEADVAATRRVIADQKGDVILVGHSYGGAVITEAGNSEKVRALVYVAAFAPSKGESINSIVGAAGKPDWSDQIHADAGGALTWSAEGMAKYFAPDIPAEKAALLAATQAPLFAGAFDGQITLTAFTDKPSWFVVADEDRIIPAALQLAFAQKMGATAIHVPTSHVAMLSQPQAVANAIFAAVESAR